MPDQLDELTASAVAALRGPGAAVRVAEVPPAPGLYAVHAGKSVWRQLGLGDPPDRRPPYVGKTERSLVGRDVETHFATGKTGSSTLRRTLAGLLAVDLDLHGQPRNPRAPGYFANFGLEAIGDERLTAWMHESLRLTVWPSPADAPLGALETAVLGELLPPLNIDKVQTAWRAAVRAARSGLAAEARPGRLHRLRNSCAETSTRNAGASGSSSSSPTPRRLSQRQPAPARTGHQRRGSGRHRDLRIVRI